MLLESYQLTNAFLFLNWLQAHQPDPQIINSLLYILTSVIQQFVIGGDQILVSNPFNPHKLTTLDRTLVKKTISKESLEGWFGPNLLVDIYRYLDDISACIQLAENMGDVKAWIAFKAIKKLNQNHTGLVFDNFSFLDLNIFPPDNACEELKELLEIGKLLHEDILRMALEHIASRLDDELETIELCIDEECQMQHKLNPSWDKLLPEDVSRPCLKNYGIYQTWLWFFEFIKASSITVDELKAKFPIITRRLTYITNLIILVSKFEKSVRCLYKNPKNVQKRAEKILHLGILMLKFTNISRVTIGLCLEKALLELPVKKHDEYVAKLSDLVEKSQADISCSQTRPPPKFLHNSESFFLSIQNVCTSKFNLSYFKWSTNLILSHLGDSAVHSLPLNEESPSAEQNPTHENVTFMKKGLFRNRPLKTTNSANSANLLMHCKFWSEVRCVSSNPIRLSPGGKFGLFLSDWYQKASKLPWQCPAETKLDMKLTLSTILTFFLSENSNLSSDCDSDSENVSLVDKEIKCESIFSQSIIEHSHESKEIIDSTSSCQKPNDPKLEKDQLSMREPCLQDRISQNSNNFDIANWSERETNEDPTMHSLVGNNPSNLNNSKEKAFKIEDSIKNRSIENDSPENNCSNSHKFLHESRIPDKITNIDSKSMDSKIEGQGYEPMAVLGHSNGGKLSPDLDTINDFIPSLDTFFIPTLPLEEVLTGSPELDTFLSRYDNETSSEFRFDDSIEFLEEEEEPDEQVFSVSETYETKNMAKKSLTLLKLNCSPEKKKDRSMQENTQPPKLLQLSIVHGIEIKNMKLLESDNLQKPHLVKGLSLLNMHKLMESSSLKRKEKESAENQIIKEKPELKSKKEKKKETPKKHNFTEKNNTALGLFEISLQKFERNLKKKQRQHNFEQNRFCEAKQVPHPIPPFSEETQTCSSIIGDRTYTVK